MKNLVSGSSFYVADVGQAFIDRVYSWLNYLRIAQFFPDLDGLDNIKAVGSNLRDIGEERLYGMADKKTGRTIIRPGDFVSLLHELYHVNRVVKGSALDSEAGALAAQVFSTGDYKRAVENFLRAKYKDEEKRAARVLTEATLVGGRDVFDWLRDVKDKTNYVNLIHYLGERINEFEGRYRHKSPLEYLIEIHSVPEEVAQKLIAMTEHDSATIVRSTDDTKKNMLGAFKGLASFLHINLGYSLDEAIARTVQMFKDEEALTINQTLYLGSKEVFARFEEYGVPQEFTVQLVRKLISEGSDRARLYAETFPQLLDLSQRFGPNGWHFLGNALRNPGFTYMLLNQNGIEVLNQMYEKDPSVVPFVLKNLLELDWRFEMDLGKLISIDRTGIFQNLPFKVDPKTKAKAIAMDIALKSRDRSGVVYDELASRGFPMSKNIHGQSIYFNLDDFVDAILRRAENGESFEELVSRFYEEVKRLPPTEELKKLESKKTIQERLSKLGLYSPRGEPPDK